MSDRGQAAIEMALAIGMLMLPVALVVTSFAPWSEQRVNARSLAAEAARSAVLTLSVTEGTSQVLNSLGSYRLDVADVRVGWCGAEPRALPGGAGDCLLTRGQTVTATISVWTPLVGTPWGPVGGLWVTTSHSEPIDLYRSLD